VVGDRPAAPEPLHQLQGLVGAGSPRGPGDLDAGEFVGVLAADANPEREAPGAKLGERRHLPRNRHRVAERDQVDHRLDQERVVGADKGSGADEPVDPGPLECHVVAYSDALQPGTFDPRHQRHESVAGLGEVLLAEEQADFQLAHVVDRPGKVGSIVLQLRYCRLR
jgi:hypothetical protein